jgi:hypothetical protein
VSHRPVASTFSASLRAAGRLAARSRPAEGPGPAEGASRSAPEPSLEPFRRAFIGSLRELHRPSGAIVFVSGSPTPALAVAQTVAALSYRVPTLVVASSGVLTHAAEVEGAQAAAGVAWSFSPRDSPTRAAVADSARDLAGKLGSGGSVLAFWAAEGFEPAEAGALSRDRQCLFGAGSPGNLVHLVENGQVSSGRVAAMRFDGAAGPIVEAASACRLVSDAMTVTQLDRGMVTTLDGDPALDVLTAKAGGGRHGGLILAAVHDFGDPERYLVRPIRGIDPGRKAIAVAAELNVGDRISFAVRDPAAAREGLSDAARRAERHALGSQATFALYLSCAGRGRSLYGESDVDVRILKKRFPGIPIAGMHSAFEIVPWGISSSKMQLMNGVLALFRAPS